ncbi:MAG: DUF4290 domain-containing protein [Marinifilaceae bacterium]|jgi:hypothetical protein|nr:DUF4290 domain-containing protein [Marinifilaceae bacterium]
MEYNTQKKRLILPEYGRNIQNMVDYALSIEDKEERTKAAYAIVSVMGNLNPHLRDVQDFKHKLWDHLAILSDGKMEIETPYPLPEYEKLHAKPEPIPYPNKKIKFKHYGKTIQDFIDKISEIEDEESRTEYIRLIASHMKIAYCQWNNTSVEDKQILKDLQRMTDFQIDKDLKLSESRPNNTNRKNNRNNRRNDKNPRFNKRNKKN